MTREILSGNIAVFEAILNMFAINVFDRSSILRAYNNQIYIHSTSQETIISYI